MWRIKVKSPETDKWVEVWASPDIQDTLDVYNELDIPRMLLGPGGIRHKQYKCQVTPKFIYRPEWAEQENRT